ENLTAFNAILKKCQYDKKLSTYLEYTCFAPQNEGVSLYLDSLYRDENPRFKHNGIAENENFFSLNVMDKIALMSDSLCEDICKYHLSGNIFQQMNIQGTVYCPTLLISRSIKAETFTDGPYKGKSSLNGTSAILDGDIKAINGILHVCSNVVPRINRTPDEQMRVEGDMKIMYEALQKTGLYKLLQKENKGIKYSYNQTGQATNRDGAKLYCPEECMVKWTVFAETDAVLKDKAGIETFEQLVEKCKEWYGTPAWYDYVKETGQEISIKDDYENPFNVVNMFVAYHILPEGIAVDKLTYEKKPDRGSWNVCFGYEPQEYYETMLKNTLLKVWCINPQATEPTLYINRYRVNNTLTDEIGTFGSDATHPIEFEGVKIDRKRSNIECLNGYIHRIDQPLLYNENAVKSQNERMRFDSDVFFPEFFNNGFRFMTGSEVRALEPNTGDDSRVAFDNTYFDNLVCYNPNTILRYCLMGDWRCYNSSQFQGWKTWDYAVKLPHVPTNTYEIRICYPPMDRGGLMQFYIGNSSDEASMQAMGIPFDARANPYPDSDKGQEYKEAGKAIGWKPILTDTEANPDTDFGVTGGQEMHVRGYMYGPASFSRGQSNSLKDKLIYDPSDIYSAAKQMTGATSCRTEYDYGLSILRRVVCTIRMDQSKDYWFRVKNLMLNSTEKDGWQLDCIELCPVSVSQSQTMTEDWY
ncbi:MAG: fasciclin domain-containing protein, partial [Prevotella sp.]|nr:fasciclin domain-containing protein [Candidatus Prevotella equi]